MNWDERQEFVGKCQDLLDVMDAYLTNSRIRIEMTREELATLKQDRDKVANLIHVIRISGLPEPKSGRPAKRYVVPIAAGVAIAPALAGAGAAGVTATEVGVVAALAEVALPIAAAIAAAYVISELTGGSTMDGLMRNLAEAIETLATDLIDMQALALSVEITAEVARKLSIKDLLKALSKALSVGQSIAVGILMAEIQRRFPTCWMALTTYRKAADRARELLKNPTSVGSRLAKELAARRAARDEAWAALWRCILGNAQGFR